MVPEDLILNAEKKISIQINRIKQDVKDVKCNISLAVTHLNEYHLDIYDMQRCFDMIYISSGYDRNSIDFS